MSLRSWWRGDAIHWQRTGVIVAVLLAVAAIMFGSNHDESNPSGDSAAGPTQAPATVKSTSPKNSPVSPQVQSLDLGQPTRTACLGSLSNDWESGEVQVGSAFVDNAVSCAIDEFVSGTYPDRVSLREYNLPSGAKHLRATIGLANDTVRPNARVHFQVKDATSNRILFEQTVGVGKALHINVPVTGVFRLGFYASVDHPSAPTGDEYVTVFIGEATLRS